MHSFCLKVFGENACFTRPEMKVERVSYDVPTPSAVRAIFEAILWKPAIRRQVTNIEVLKPIRWSSVCRNEVGAVASSRTAQTAMQSGRGGSWACMSKRSASSAPGCFCATWHTGSMPISR